MAIVDSCATECPECKSARMMDYSDGKTVCMNCGLVISSIINDLDKKLNADKHENLSQQISLLENKVSTHGNLSFVLEQWRNMKIEDSTEKNLHVALQCMTEIAVALSLPRTALEKACLAYKAMVERGLIKGRTIRSMSAAATSFGCKQCQIPITIRDVAHVLKMNLKSISHCYSLISKQFGPIQQTGIGEYAVEISKRLQLSPLTLDLVTRIIKALEESKSLAGKNPIGIACAAIYLGSRLTQERKTQREIAEAARITETTIRTRCGELERNLMFILQLAPKEFREINLGSYR